MTRVGKMWLGAVVCVLGFGVTHAQAVDPKYLPSDTEIVFTVNLKQILASDVVKKNKDAVEQIKAKVEKEIANRPDAAELNCQLTKYLKALGFDPLKDLHSITVATGATSNTENLFIVIEGNFNADKFYDTAEDAAKNDGDVVKISKEGNDRIIERTPKDGNAPSFASLSGKDTLIVAGSKVGLTDGLARVAGTKKNNLKKEVRSLLETTNSKQSISFVATGAAIAKVMDEKTPDANRKQVDGVIEKVKDIEGFSGAVTFGENVQFLIGVNTKDADTAKNMAKEGQQILMIAQLGLQLQAQNNEKLLPLIAIVRTLKIASEGSNLLIQGQIAPDVITDLLKNLPKEN